MNYGDLFEMPPDSKLPQEEIDLLTKWVEMKAPWPVHEADNTSKVESFDLEARREEHWCWQPIRKPPVPSNGDSVWAIDDIDRFVFNKLAEKKMSPAPPADRGTWIRRIYVDLIGLPPTPQQVDDFVNDQSPNALEKVVDQLLASPHFGERWARHWMDLIRYAETCGHEFDYPIPNAYQYRDYLIRAFNADVPYDDLVKEHIAGDLLSNPRRHPQESFNESIIATGFWFLGEATHGPVDVKADEAGHIDNRIDVMSKTFLGLTVACARCHDHKFDAISIQDYYALSGFFQSSRRQDALLDPGRKIADKRDEISELVTQADSQVAAVLDAVKSEFGSGAAEYLLATIESIAEHPAWLNTQPIKIEAEKMTTISQSAGNVVVQDLKPQGNAQWSGNQQLWWYEGKEGDSFVVEFEVPYQAAFELSGNFTTAVDYGIVEIALDDQVIVEKLDLFSKTIGVTGDRQLGVFDLESGKHRLTIKSIGTNPEALSKYMFGLDYLRLNPVGVERANVEKQQFLQAKADLYELDAEVLKQWIAGFARPEVARHSHPLFVARELALQLSKQNSDDFPAAWQTVEQQINTLLNQAEKTRQDSIKFADFEQASFDQWFETGFAFGGQPTLNVEVETADGQRLLTPPGLAHSGKHGRRMYGVLRSPTFEIKHSNIHYRMLSEDIQVRLIIDGFVLDNLQPAAFRRYDVQALERRPIPMENAKSRLEELSRTSGAH